jgi:hypothetical protein
MYPLKLTLVYIIFNNLILTPKRTPNFTITKIDWLMLFKEIIAVYKVNHTKYINTKSIVIDSIADGAYTVTA